VAPADNEAGWRMALEKLARLVEANQQTLKTVYNPSELEVY
jgi:hypothetical protein